MRTLYSTNSTAYITDQNANGNRNQQLHLVVYTVYVYIYLFVHWNVNQCIYILQQNRNEKSLHRTTLENGIDGRLSFTKNRSKREFMRWIFLFFSSFFFFFFVTAKTIAEEIKWLFASAAVYVLGSLIRKLLLFVSKALIIMTWRSYVRLAGKQTRQSKNQSDQFQTKRKKKKDETERKKKKKRVLPGLPYVCGMDFEVIFFFKRNMNKHLQ